MSYGGDEYDALLPEDEQHIMSGNFQPNHVLTGPEQFSDDVFVNYGAYFPENVSLRSCHYAICIIVWV